MMTTFKNTSGKGNTVALHVIVEDAPHSDAGKAHASVRAELNDGQQITKAGQYFPTREGADKWAGEWVAKCGQTVGWTRV